MRLVAVLLLFTALASFQLPWVMCAEQSIHVGNHWAAEHEHDGGEEHEHEPIDWSAIAQPRTLTVLEAPVLQVVALCTILPVAAEANAAPQARALAPPVAACPQTTVLLL